MAAADMNPTPFLSSSPADPPKSQDDCTTRDYVTRVTVLFIVGVIALLLMHVLGSLRRSSSHKLIHAIVFGVYTLSYPLVSYTLGFMSSSDIYVDEFAVWSMCLLLLLGNTDSLTACRLNDIDNWKSIYLKHLFKGALAVWIIILVTSYYNDAQPIYKGPVWTILVVIILKSYARIASMKMASKSHVLYKNVKPIADYMKHEHQPLESGHTPDPTTMEGYRYIVAGEHRQQYHVKLPDYALRYTEDNVKFITVEQIWRCTGSLLCSERGLKLKDICLSMSLSKMINRRFTGFELAEARLQKTQDFVFGGLLGGNRAYERTFRVIEVELAFVHDLYYTAYPYLSSKSLFFAFCLPITMVFLCSWLTSILFNHYEQQKNINHSGDSSYIYTLTTLFSVVVITLLEVFQLYLYMASGWFKVTLIRSYVTRPILQRSRYFSQMTIGLILRLKSLPPWQRKLGQYSFLHNFDCARRPRNCLHYVTLCLVDKAKKGSKRGKLVNLSTQVKQAVIASLVQSNGHLTNGVRSLQNNGVYEKLSWACGADDARQGTITRTILMWHIATTFCKHKLDAAQAKFKQNVPNSEEDTSTTIGTASSVASSLSQYCAYLIAFMPNLLPDHISISELILDESIKEARKMFQAAAGANTMESKCEKLTRISAPVAADGDNGVVVMGAQLARALTEDIEDPALRWKVLSEFWAEMMLYIAPCGDAQAREHLEALARGGEFITHLWALLTHAGVLERPAVPQAAV